MKRDGKQVLTELLVYKAQARDERAFADLYDLWKKDLARLAQITIRDAGGVEEVAQDAWVAIAKGLGRLDDPARFPSWAFRILNRRCADWIRRRQQDRRRKEAIEEGEQFAESHGSGEQAESSINLSEAIAKLDTDSRQLLHLFYETGLSVADIGQALDVPAGTVKSRLFKTREKLKRYLERKNNE